jgi:hypothetical protein
MALIDALERLETILRGLGTPAAQALRPGLPAAEVEAQLASIGLTAPADLLTWYGWHNGSAAPDGPLGDAEFLPNWWFGSVEDMVALYRDDVHWLLDEIGHQGVEWFPILKSRTGDYHVLMRCDGLAPGEIAFIANGAFEPDLYKPRSLEEPLVWWADYIENGKYAFEAPTEIFRPTWKYGDLPEPISGSNLLM